ncbi:PAS domain-containing sensor histidine kinase [Phyllobacterium leguminum]|uniref:histidine kinase n=1 Tax=Phyllobacterium leguminum TaxID=314237 RepID=A0A318T8K2_9HYPH|nr:ATP-binding protein [Phyllobacterium leguminum]PYE86964.1 PAS domain S-box-containing protein [Phyllobacterium leguminum]
MTDMAWRRGCVDNIDLSANTEANELADLASDSVIVFDLTGNIRYWNPASETLYGWPAIGAVGRSIGDMSANTAVHITQWQSLMQEGAWEGHVDRRTLWGGRITASVRQTVRCSADGRPRDVVEYGRCAGKEPPLSSALDIDVHRLATASWEFDISGVRPLIEQIADLFSRGAMAELAQQPDWTDELLEGARIVDVNERAAHLVGAHVGRAGMIGQSASAFWPRVGRDVLAELIVAVATDHSRGIPRMRKLACDGVLRDPVVTAWRSEEGGRPDIVFVAVNGATDDDRSFWYLRASEERYRKLIHHLPTALLQVDASRMAPVFEKLKNTGVSDLNAYLDQHPELVEFMKNVVRITEANQRAVALFGGTAPADFITPVAFLFEASPQTPRRIMLARFEGKRNYTEIMKVRTFDGRLLDVQLSVTFPAPPERLDVTLFSLEDITERLRTERQLRQVETDFTHAARVSMLGEFATSIAHEINQPLSAIVTNGETSLRWLSRDNPNRAKVEQLTTRIVSSARHASDIVQRIRGMAAKHEPARVSLDLNDVIEEALLFVRHDIEAKSIHLSVRLASNLPVILADRVQLQQVIVNLLVNSIQAIAQGCRPVRKIDLATRVDGEGAVVFSIHDSGPGIPDENLDNIFDSFFTTKETGMGIGLAVCQSIILAHGGSIGASNCSDGGAQFRFSLPVPPKAD